MSKLNAFAVFGILFLSSILLANGMYSNNVSIFAEQENEAEVIAEIEQDNKCKKDTECENENELNNSLNIITQNSTQIGEQELTCETCFTDNLTPQEVTAYETILDTNTVFSSIEELCLFIEENPESSEISSLIYYIGDQAGIDIGALQQIDQCLEEFFGIIIPNPT